jgi:hypothetical protein
MIGILISRINERDRQRKEKRMELKLMGKLWKIQHGSSSSSVVEN